jgi:hypothetical protein
VQFSTVCLDEIASSAEKTRRGCDSSLDELQFQAHRERERTVDFWRRLDLVVSFLVELSSQRVGVQTTDQNVEDHKRRE